MANGDTNKALMLLEADIGDLLKDDETSDRELMKGILRVQRAIIPFLVQQQDDHEKVEKIYPVIQILKWAGAALGLANLGLLWDVLTHKVTMSK